MDNIEELFEGSPTELRERAVKFRERVNDVTTTALATRLSALAAELDIEARFRTRYPHRAR
jgi:predicted component of type VI protein secretion system